MAYTVEIKGKSADRFRAYGAAKLTRNPRVADHIKRAEAKLPPFKPGTKIRYDGEEVAIEGAVSGEALSITTEPGTTITKVVFYKGPVETEAVVGSVEVNATGRIDIEFVDPDQAAAGPQIVDE